MQAVFRPTPGFKMRIFKFWVPTDGALISASAVSHCGRVCYVSGVFARGPLGKPACYSLVVHLRPRTWLGKPVCYSLVVHLRTSTWPGKPACYSLVVYLRTSTWLGKPACYSLVVHLRTSIWFAPFDLLQLLPPQKPSIIVFDSSDSWISRLQESLTRKRKDSCRSTSRHTYNG